MAVTFEEPTAVRIGLVGCGNLAINRLLPALKTLPVQLVSVCDTDAGRAAEAAARFSAEQCHSDYRALIGDNLDAILAAVGPERHPEIACHAMESGIPVFTEKPPATNAAESAEMLATSRRTGVTCMVGFKKRFAPVYRKAQAAMCGGELGTVSLVTIQAGSGPYNGTGRDFLLDFGIHAIDLARFLGGEIAEVAAARSIGGDTYAVTLVYTSGALGLLALSSRRAWKLPLEVVEVTGTDGSSLTITGSIELLRFRNGDVSELHRPAFSTMAGDSLVESGFQPEIAAFVDAVQSGAEPESSIREAHATMLLHDAIVAAVRRGGSVRPGATE